MIQGSKGFRRYMERIMAGKMKDDSWQLRIESVLMLIFGIGGFLYSAGIIIPLATGTVAALQIPLPLYLFHLILSFVSFSLYGGFGFRTLAKPGRVMKKIAPFTEGTWLLLVTFVFQAFHLFFVNYLKEGLMLPSLFAAAELVLLFACLMEKRKITASRRPS